MDPLFSLSDLGFWSDQDDTAALDFGSQLAHVPPRTYYLPTSISEEDGCSSGLHVLPTPAPDNSNAEYYFHRSRVAVNSSDSSSSVVDTDSLFPIHPSDPKESIGQPGHSSRTDAPSMDQEDGRTRCEFSGCQTSFKRKTDRIRHMKTIHDPNATRHVCGCCSEGTKKLESVRQDKIKPHKVDKHGCPKTAFPRACEDQDAHENQTFWFCSKANFQTHLRSVHGLSDMEAQRKVLGEDSSDNAAVPLSNSLDPAPSESAMVMPGPQGTPAKSSNPSTKRPISPSPVLVVKRPRLKEPGLKGAQLEAQLRSAFSNFWRSLETPSGDDDRSKFEINRVEASEFLRLTKLGVLPGPAYMEVLFDTARNVVSLQGLTHRARALRTILSLILDNGISTRLIRNATPIKLPCNLPGQIDQAPQRSSTVLATHEDDIRRTLTLRDDTDALLAQEWHEIIVPILGTLLDESIGGNHFATLEHPASSRRNGKITLRIFCRRLPSEHVRNHVQEKVSKIFNTRRYGCELVVRLSRGELRCLAGDDTEGSDDDDGDEDDYFPYPHYKRHWQRPGMGASLGMLNDDGTHASLGCWIYIEGVPHCVTVKHFIKAHAIDGFMQGSSLEVMSPSYYALGSLGQDLSQFQSETKIAIERVMCRMATNGTQLSSSTTDNSEELEELNGYRETIEADLEASGKPIPSYIFGTVAFLSGCRKDEISQPLSSHVDPWNASQNQGPGHWMDWAAIKSVPHRVGMNRHRFLYDSANGGSDYIEDGNGMGAGETVQKLSPVMGGEAVHYVGQGSGLFRGFVDKFQMSVTQNGKRTLEWFMKPSDNRSKDVNQYAGDSGSAVIRDSDNSVIGLVWAQTPIGVIFTSMQHVLDDIKTVAGTDNVCLAPDRTPPGSATGGPAVAAPEVVLTCGDKLKCPPRSKRQRPDLSTIPWKKATRLPAQKPLLAPSKHNQSLGPETDLSPQAKLDQLPVPADPTTRPMGPHHIPHLPLPPPRSLSWKSDPGAFSLVLRCSSLDMSTLLMRMALHGYIEASPYKKRLDSKIAKTARPVADTVNPI